MQSEPLAAPELSPRQLCFIVADVPKTVAFCEEHFGWGPFMQFKAPVANASYRGWSGEKLTEVALGMAGGGQIEFLRVHFGHDTTMDYQSAYGTGLQHIGIRAASRDSALEHLTSLGASVNELNEYPGIRFAFVDVPTGPGMFEILEPLKEKAASNFDATVKRKSEDRDQLKIDRATIVTRNIDKALSFYGRAFSWGESRATDSVLACNDKEFNFRRFLKKHGRIELEFLEPDAKDDTPYSHHLNNVENGLIHASGLSQSQPPLSEAMQGEWTDTGERFSLYDWAGGKASLQIRRS